MVGSLSLLAGDPTLFSQLIQRDTVVRRHLAAPLPRALRRAQTRPGGRAPSLAGKVLGAQVIRPTTATHPLHTGVDTNTIHAWLGTPSCRRQISTPRSMSRPRRSPSPARTNASPLRPRHGGTGRASCSSPAPCESAPLCGVYPGCALARQGLAPPSSHSGAMHICHGQSVRTRPTLRHSSMCWTNDGPNAIHDLPSCVRPRGAARNTGSSVQSRPERCRQKLTCTHGREYDCIARNEAVLRPAKLSPYQLPDSSFDNVAAWFFDQGHEAVIQGFGRPGPTS